ncbi:MAG: hypothetical protein E5X13_10600 [Mesorhizobium sp.]|nr:MAG: hypothetical protein E5X13_10600 [Mesorhizobium sp.]
MVRLSSFQGKKKDNEGNSRCLPKSGSPRLPQSQVEFACKGQSWGAENAECLRAIAEQSGQHRARAVRMIANAAPLTDTPNVF